MPTESNQPPLRLTDFKVLSFDCYGTLIDWETGIYDHLQPLLARSGVSITRDQALEAYARHEEAQEAETPGHALLRTCWRGSTNGSPGSGGCGPS